MPMSGVACSMRLHDHFKTHSIGYGSTYQAHPMAAAMAIETIDRMQEEHVLENVTVIEDILRKHMTELADTPLFKNEFRIHGAFGCMDMQLTDNGEVNEGIIECFAERMRRQGVIHMFRPPLFHIAPPLNCTADEIDEAFERIHIATNDTVSRYVGEWRWNSYE